ACPASYTTSLCATAAQPANREIGGDRCFVQPPCDTLWAKNGKYEYCYQFSNSEIWLNLPSSANSERHKVPNRHVYRVDYIQSESIGLKYFPDDMLLLKPQYSYLPFFAHRVYSRIVSCASSPPHGRQNPFSNSYRTF
ncbi:hypothetical protein, partial [Collinsella sp. AM12-1]|uniref:hypothetical protein n=1 Tax=Collinsella sp. AM12-1 TaxID=2292023 RepID=UPI001F1B2266